MTEQKMGLSDEEKQRIADTVKGMKNRRKSVLDPPEEIVTRRISVLDELPVEKSEPEFEATESPKEPPPEAPTPKAPTKKSKVKKVSSPPVEPSPAAEDDDSLFNESDFGEDESEEKPKSDPEPKPEPVEKPSHIAKRKEQSVSPAEAVLTETWQERGKMTTRVVIKYDLLEEESSVLSASTTDGTKVKVGLGFTINLGEMAFARVDVGLELPTTKEDIPEAYSTAWKISEREIRHQVDLIEKSPLNKKKKEITNE